MTPITQAGFCTGAISSVSLFTLPSVMSTTAAQFHVYCAFTETSDFHLHLAFFCICYLLYFNRKNIFSPKPLPITIQG